MTLGTIICALIGGYIGKKLLKNILKRRGSSKMKLDPRSKLFVLAITSVLTFLNGSIIVECILAALPLMLLFLRAGFAAVSNTDFSFWCYWLSSYGLFPLCPSAWVGSSICLQSTYASLSLVLC